MMKYQMVASLILALFAYVLKCPRARHQAPIASGCPVTAVHTVSPTLSKWA